MSGAGSSIAAKLLAAFVGIAMSAVVAVAADEDELLPGLKQPASLEASDSFEQAAAEPESLADPQPAAADDLDKLMDLDIGDLSNVNVWRQRLFDGTIE